MYPPVLDVCCGSRMFWFDPNDSRCLFVDKRKGTWVVDQGNPATKGRKPIVVDPDVQADFTNLPFPDNTFSLVVFDPPHVLRKTNNLLGIITKTYGVLSGDWEGMLSQGFRECFRVLKPTGVLVFKWGECSIPLAKILSLTPEKPLFGHRSGKKMGTHWVCFLKG